MINWGYNNLQSNSMVHELVMQETLTYKAEEPDFHSISVEVRIHIIITFNS